VTGVVSVDEAARMAMDLPGVTEGDSRGNRSWSVGGSGKGGKGSGKGKVFAWVRPFSKADIKRFGAADPPDGPILAVRVEDLHEKEAVLAAGPEGFFTIPHFDGYAAVLIELDRVDEQTLREAIVDAWLACAPPALADEYLGDGRLPD